MHLLRLFKIHMVPLQALLLFIGMAVDGLTLETCENMTWSVTFYLPLKAGIGVSKKQELF